MVRNTGHAQQVTLGFLQQAFADHVGRERADEQYQQRGGQNAEPLSLVVAGEEAVGAPGTAWASQVA